MTQPLAVSPYEGSAEPIPSGEFEGGVTVYDPYFPLHPAVIKGTDTAVFDGQAPGGYVEWTDLDYEIGGQAGLVNRNAFILGGLEAPDAHDFRGDHAIVPRREISGTYGDVGSSDDFAGEYAQGIAAQGYPDISREESWSRISEGY